MSYRMWMLLTISTGYESNYNGHHSTLFFLVLWDIKKRVGEKRGDFSFSFFFFMYHLSNRTEQYLRSVPNQSQLVPSKSDIVLRYHFSTKKRNYHFILLRIRVVLRYYTTTLTKSCFYKAKNYKIEKFNLVSEAKRVALSENINKKIK